ncbi:Rho termination factor [Alcanivorax sp. KX64203]|nr:Rho termination factor [Alcanivorax sp. KX64203]
MAVRKARSTQARGKQIKNPDQYEALRDRGMSKSKAARIANTPNAGRKGGKQPSYEDWTREALYQQARKVGIEGRSGMKKAQLIDALRHH